jgi:hypothetical protein
MLELDYLYLYKIYKLIIYFYDSYKSYLAINNTVIILALNLLISFDNIRLKVIALIRNKLLTSTKYSLILRAYY